MTTFFEPQTISRINQLEKVSHTWTPEKGWAFRGHKNDALGLSTTLHLACDRHAIGHHDAPDIERLLLREFARKAHLYVRDGADLPDPSDTLEWMSLMRHFGAPTRLLDWTYSIFVAAYFALDSSLPGEPCLIWAIDTRWLNDTANSISPGLDKGANADADKTGKHFRDHFMPAASKAFVSTENPYRLNARSAIQHGTFLCPGDVRRTFTENLEAMSSTGSPHAYRLELSASPDFRTNLGRLLYRQNINTEVLFPGLEGLARALRDRIPHLRNIGSRRGDVGWLGRAPK
jgi:hypothetical protein